MTTNILFTQPIFAPDTKRLERNLNSILSLKENYDYMIDGIYMGGYAREDWMWEKIYEVTKDIPNCIITKYNTNYGKAYVINDLVKKATEKNTYHFMLTADSDILFLQPNKFMIPRLLECVERTIEKKHKPFGVVALNQQGYNCNMIPECSQNTFEYTNIFGQKERVLWNNAPAYIAGGCLFTSIDAWKKVNGYRIMGVYAGDEAYYLQDMSRIGHTWQLIETIHVEHPHENDLEYAQWKGKVCQRDSTGKVKNDISKQIQEAEEFWRKRCQ